MSRSNSTSSRHLSRLTTALVIAVMLAAGLGIAPGSNAATSSAASDPASLVNVFIGTGNGGKVSGKIHTFPGAAMPFGMLTWSPATTTRPSGGGYLYGDSTIHGFSLTHISGPGCSGAAGDIPILPSVGTIGMRPETTSEPFTHSHEHATPGEYTVTLAPGTPTAIAVKLATTTRTGIGTFHFPATKKANFLFKVSDAQTTSPASTVNIVGNDRIEGSETAGHFCGTAGTVTLYFVARFNRPFDAYGTWDSSTPKAGAHTSTGAHTGAWVSFDTTHNRDVQLKVAISYVSVTDAWANLRAEQHGWHFEHVAHQAHQAWNKLLSRIAVSGGSHDQQVQFYSALYHTLLHPNVFSDANGRYIGFDDKVHTLANGQTAQYANFSGWDIYRSEIPLLALLVPKRVGNMMTSLLNDQKQGGWLPKWGYDNDYTGVMNGDAADPIIAEAWAFGVRNFDARSALAAMIKGATESPAPFAGSGRYIERPNLHEYERLGYVPDYPSETLEYALDDFAIARFAKSLGDMQTYRKFIKRSGNWANVFDRQAKFRGYTGYAEPRSVDGKFPTGPAFGITGDGHGNGRDGFEEGNTLQYTWMVPQDVRGLIKAMGGNRHAIARLDLLFTHLNVGSDQPYYWAGNEVCLGIPWLYDYMGVPWKTQAIVHRLIGAVYSDTPGGEPGNDDLGAMSSWLVWADLGMFPETPGAPVLVIGAPVFPRITLQLGNGHVIYISAKGADLHHYVQHLYVNGQRWNKDWFPVGPVAGPEASGGSTRVVFELGTEPSHTWGTAASEQPPSWTP